jgi:hypothetical protein
VETEIDAIIAGDAPKTAEAKAEETRSSAHTEDETTAPGGKLRPLPS